MALKPDHFAFEFLESKIHQLYIDLYRSSSGIFTLVKNEIKLKGIFDLKTAKLVNLDKRKEFELFQEILRNLNNVIYFNSLLLVSYSIFELAFKEICEFVEDYSSPQIKFFPPNREIIQGYRKYLSDSKYVNFSSQEIDSKYSYLIQRSKVRNLIAHENANLIIDKSKSLDQQKNYKEFKAMKELSILQNGQIYINTEDFIQKFIEESESFLGLIIKQLKEQQP